MPSRCRSLCDSERAPPKLLGRRCSRPHFTAPENVMMPMPCAADFANEAVRVRAAALIAGVGLTKCSVAA